MDFTRRQLLQWMAATAAGGAMIPALEGLARAMSAQEDSAPILWINEDGDHLNLLVLLGGDMPPFLELAANHWNLVHYDPLTGVDAKPHGALKGAPVVILEVLPKEAELSGEPPWPFSEIAEAKAAILLGTGACYGDLHQSSEDLDRLEQYCRRHNTPVIKLPGVPVAPHHLVGTLSHLELMGFPDLDRHQRPVLYYGETVCNRCEWRGHLERGQFAGQFGQPGCLMPMGCKGPVTHNSCAVVKWNGGENWCVGAGGPCTGCSEPGYPDHAGLGLYGRLPGDRQGMHSALLQNLRGLGWSFFALATVGMGLRSLRGAFSPGAPRHIRSSQLGGE